MVRKRNIFPKMCHLGAELAQWVKAWALAVCSTWGLSPITSIHAEKPTGQHTLYPSIESKDRWIPKGQPASLASSVSVQFSERLCLRIVRTVALKEHAQGPLHRSGPHSTHIQQTAHTNIQTHSIYTRNTSIWQNLLFITCKNWGI